MAYAEELAITVSKDDPKLLEELKSIIEDGTYEKISNKWFGMNIL
ncbi:transporter substrate-binding domain-containing protein [Acetobacterium sp. K1/6]|nr:transporter substrate-binding domain-containing protein [Acetobacterium sp. K1/6]MDZ5724118.1 transporter substrate-binding domain-containing protein [Acetobacterium sp. K1/6]